MKVRVIPSILTDGLTVVKGENFNNWRTVGSAEATARLYASRNVDELLFLDVTARERNTLIDLKLLTHFSNVLDVPFSVGGGIRTVEDAKKCLRNGAEKIVLGTSAILQPNLITQVADIFGNQAIIVAVDFAKIGSDISLVESGKTMSGVNTFDYLYSLEALGAGEILLQSVERDGTLMGMDFEKIAKAKSLTNLPIIASGGAASVEDFEKAVLSGASAIAAGALFQFTEITPGVVRNYLSTKGIAVRTL